MKTRQLDLFNNESMRWDHYVMENDDASHCHLSGWGRVIQNTYGHRPLYFIAEEGNETRGILPLIEMNTSLFGRSLASVPFLDYGGICADDEYVQKELFSEMLNYCNREKIKTFDLRHRQPSGLNLERYEQKVTLILNLESQADQMWKSLDAKVRNQVRKAVKSQLSVQWAGVEALDDFYRVYATNMRDLGSPAHSRKFFQAIFEEFNHSRLVLAKFQDQIIGGGLCLYLRETVLVPWASSLRAFFRYCPNNLIYWEAIRSACEQGFQKFDFGRSSYGSGTYNFKRQWGAIEQPLCWEYWSKDKRSKPILQGNDSRYGTAVRLWKKTPLTIANRIGPMIRKQLSN